MTKSALVLLATGFEECEAVVPIDMLRRANINVTVAGVGGKTVAGAHDLSIVVDEEVANCVGKPFDVVVLPGGLPGATNLFESDEVFQILKAQKQANKLIAAICASPTVVLLQRELLEGVKEATAYPGFDKKLPCNTDKVVCYSNHILTSKGPGTAFDFALKIIEVLVDADTAKQVGQGACFKTGWSK